MPLLGEVAPAAPALAGLLEIAVLLFCFAFVWTVRKLIAALFGWLISILNDLSPPGFDLASPFRVVEQAVSNALGTAEHAIDAAMGASWHLLARYMDWMWREIRGHAVLLLEIASGIYPLVLAYHVVKALLHHNTVASGVAAARVKTLEKEYAGIDRQLRTLEKEYHGIDQLHVRHRFGKIEAQLGTLEAQTIPAIRQAEHDASSAISNLYEWAKGKASLIGVGTFTAAVATALSALGLDWLACRSRSSVNGKAGCALWNDIESLLGAAIVTGLALDLPALIGEAQKVTPGIITGIEDLAGLGK